MAFIDANKHEWQYYWELAWYLEILTSLVLMLLGIILLATQKHIRKMKLTLVVVILIMLLAVFQAVDMWNYNYWTTESVFVWSSVQWYSFLG